MLLLAKYNRMQHIKTCSKKSNKSPIFSKFQDLDTISKSQIIIKLTRAVVAAIVAAVVAVAIVIEIIKAYSKRMAIV
jgi:hypothetical protein